MTNKDIFKGTNYDSLDKQVWQTYKAMKIQPAEFVNEKNCFLQKATL